MGTLVTEFAATLELSGYEEIRQALFNPDLSRTFDTRGYHEGNIRDGIVSTAHGPLHRARRRVENTQFRPEVLRLYEDELFPGIVDDILDLVITQDEVDIFPIGELLSVVLAARRAGVDVDVRDLDQLHTLVRFVDAFSQGSAILDARDPDAVRDLVYATYEEFERDWIRPSWAARAPFVQRYRAGELAEADLPQDILTVLLLHRDDPRLELEDDGRVVREVATYLQGGTHTAAQTIANAMDLLFEAERATPGVIDRMAADRLFAQRVVHETLRLRPTTPKIRRRTVAPTTVAGVELPENALVVLDQWTGNRDAAVFGADAERFNPDRPLEASVPRWGLAFGAGAHQCPGRNVAGGFPVRPEFDVEDGHLFGLVALELQAFARRGVREDPAKQPERDPRTDRTTRWWHYPVRFTRRTARA